MPHKKKEDRQTPVKKERTNAEKTSDKASSRESERKAELLTKWQERAELARKEMAAERALMDEREAIYLGSRDIDRVSQSGELQSGSSGAPATVVRNIVSECIESLVDSSIPQPKVTARRREDEALALLIEDALRAELDRLPFEQLNDLDERTTPIQGGDFFHVEWNCDGHGDGELSVTLCHPRQLLPQPGVTSIEDMDYVILEQPQTKQRIKRLFGVDVEAEGEESPQARGAKEAQEELVTMLTAYYRDEKGEIGRVRWVGDTLLEDLPSYQSHVLHCSVECGAAMDEVCPVCGGKQARQTPQEYFELPSDAQRSDGSVVPGVAPSVDESGSLVFDDLGYPAMSAMKIPYYRPGRYPLILRKNVSLFGRLLGDSDVDKIRDQQNAIKKVGTRVEEKIGKGGSIVTMPKQLSIRRTDEELKIVELDNPNQRAMIDVLTIQPDISRDLTYLEYNYQASRQILGLTDSFQGRSDSSATSGVAKQFAAAQTAGRMESKRVMKQAAYGALFELMFRFLLAYCDQPRTIARRTPEGKVSYAQFNRYDFLQRDELGNWHWNDDFLFSVDAASTLANNRSAMWGETLASLRSGAFGDPTNLETLILYWSKMELLHYPGAKDTKEQLEHRRAQAVTGANLPGVAGLPGGNGLPVGGSGLPGENGLPDGNALTGGETDALPFLQD